VAAKTIVFLHSSAGRYGADRLLLSLASGLDRDRFTPVAVLPERGELAGPLEDAGVEAVVADLAVLRRAELGPRAAWRMLRARDRELEALARSRGAALVHSNTSVILSGQRLAESLGVPHVLHVRELYPRVPLAWPLWRRRLLRADRVVCMSKAIADQFAGSSKAVVIYDGLPRATSRGDRERARADLGVDPNGFVIALLGRISDWKGQDVLARALAEPALADRSVVGVIAGSPWPGAEGALRKLERLQASLSLGDRLRLVGFRDDIGTLFAAADAVAVPSTRPEPFGLVALEAAAAGLPVVAAAHGGLPEIIRHEQTGLLVAPNDPSALAAALRRLADDPNAAAAMGAAAAAAVSERFRPEATTAAVEALYGELLP
jgi:glycosyltransferase involved in cell wall biosynthesis